LAILIDLGGRPFVLACRLSSVCGLSLVSELEYLHEEIGIGG